MSKPSKEAIQRVQQVLGVNNKHLLSDKTRVLVSKSNLVQCPLFSPENKSCTGCYGAVVYVHNTENKSFDISSENTIRFTIGKYRVPYTRICSACSNSFRRKGGR